MQAKARYSVRSLRLPIIALVGLFNLLLIAKGQNSPPRGEPAVAPQQIIAYGGGGWKDGQVNEPVILVNPKDQTKLIMFYSAMQLGGGSGAIGKAWANIDSPLDWHEDVGNPIMSPDPRYSFEESSIRLDTAIYRKETDEYWLYYTGNNSGKQFDAIGLAICPAGDDGYSSVSKLTIKRDERNPILSPGGQGRTDETFVSQGAVIEDGGLWYSLYSYRTATETLPGVRLATSPDGRSWQKVKGDDLLKAGPESQYIEWHQVQKIGDQYVLLYEGYNGGQRWGADVATSAHLDRGWVKAPMDSISQVTWANYSDNDKYHVATPAIYQIGGKWHFYFQAAPSGFYSIQHWALWGVECDETIKSILKKSAQMQQH